MARKITVIEPLNLTIVKKARVAAYCRVSSDKSEQTNSYSVQKAYFTNLYADSETEELVGVYADIGSGTSNIYRTEFLRMLDDCRHRRIDRIITKSLSRFARNTKECLQTLRELKKLGVTVAFEKECIDTARVPYGYVKNRKKQIVIDEPAAAVIRRIFSLYLSGDGARKIAVLFTEEGIPSPTGKAWSNVTIFKILRQEKYIGDIRWQKTYSTFMGEKWKINHGEEDSFYVRDCLPPVISREEFIAAQTLRKRNTRTAKNTTDSPFRGKTKCTCGRSFSLVKKGRKYFWECSGKYDLQRPCGNPVFADASYHAAWERMCIKLRKYADKIIFPCIEQCERLEDNLVSGEITALEKQYDELSHRKYVLSSLCANGCITREKFIKADADADAEMGTIKKRLDTLNEQCDDTSDQLETLYKMICKMTVNQLLKTVLVNAVSDGKTVTFELLGGLKFEEVLR